MYEVTYREILERMLNRVSDKFDKREGSVIFDTHSPTALELEILYVELNRMIAEGYGDTASREYLILRCKERGIIPYPATYAVLKGTFTPATVDVIGKRFNLGSLNYIVTEKIADGEYRVQCETPGTVGNQYFGQLIPIEYVEGLETATLTEVLIPGEDEEDTEDLRTRYFNSFDEKAFGGNVRDYIEKTNAIPGVGSTKVTRVWNGDIRPADMIPNEIVNEWYEGIIGTVNPTVKAWLEIVYSAAKAKKLTVGGTVLLTILNSEYGVPTPELIQTVQTAIDPEQNAGEGYGLAPIGHVVTVKPADAVTINVKTTITFDVGYGWNNLQSSIDEAIQAYLLELRKTWADNPYLVVRVSQIETRLLAISGIVDIENTRINNKTDNLTLRKYEVPIYGGAGA
jgi:uncharacterized phage protein gp47/JayE